MEPDEMPEMLSDTSKRVVLQRCLVRLQVAVAEARQRGLGTRGRASAAAGMVPSCRTKTAMSAPGGSVIGPARAA